jgi:hypothetical protein
MALVDRAQNGFGTLDGISVAVDGVPAEAPVQALDGEVREHFDRLYDSLWKQVLGVVDYRARLSKGRLSADAFEEAQGLRSRLRKRVAEQKELLGICVFEAERASFGVAKAAAPFALGAAAAQSGGLPRQPQAGHAPQGPPPPALSPPAAPQPALSPPAVPQPAPPQPEASAPSPNVADRQQ